MPNKEITYTVYNVLKHEPVALLLCQADIWQPCQLGVRLQYK